METTDAQETVKLDGPPATAECLPAECERSCAAVLAAWELVLLECQSQRLEQSSQSEQQKGGGASCAPHELIPMALQLTPDLVASTETIHGWPSLPSPFL